MSSAKDKIVNKIKKSPTPKERVTHVLECLRSNNNYEAMELVCTNLDVKLGVKFLMSKFSKSKFKAYSIPMRRLTEVANNFVNFDDTASAFSYKTESKDNADGALLKMKMHILDAIIHGDSRRIHAGLVHLCNYEHQDYDTFDETQLSKSQTLLGKYAAELAALRWPGNEALKVLYG